MSEKSKKKFGDFKEVMATVLEAGVSIVVWLHASNKRKALIADFQMKRLLKLYVEAKWFEIKKRKRIIALYYPIHLRFKKHEAKVEKIDGQMQDLAKIIVDTQFPLKKSA
jgi:hypothetical protein